MKDLTYYDLLQVNASADIETITAAYHSLIKRYHPDVSTDPNASEISQKLNEAYGVLSDPAKRTSYDAELRRNVRRGDSQEPLRTSGPFRGTQADEIRRHVIRRYISPARSRQVSEITVRAGDVHDETRSTDSQCTPSARWKEARD